MPRLTVKKQAPKGVRLGWALLKDAQPAKVVLTSVKGVKVTPVDVRVSKTNKSSNRSYLIP